MDFDLNDEQRQLKDSVERLLAASYGDLNKRMGYMKEPKGYSARAVEAVCDLGLLGCALRGGARRPRPGPHRDHDHRRGVRAGARHRALFRHRRASGGALRHSGNEALLKELVPAIVEGKLTLALAHQERQARYDIADTATTARSDGKGGYTLEGEKNVVLHGD